MVPTRPPSACPRCPAATRGRCTCTRRVSDQRRGNATDRGYGRRHRRVFRAEVLQRHLFCQCRDASCRSHGDRCVSRSSVADHWPMTRRELVAAGEDPDDPKHGRGLCKPCHDHATATDPRTRGGWHATRPAERPRP